MELDGFKDLEQQRQAREDFFEKSFDLTYIEKGKHEDAEKWHKAEASKLSDKEHTGEEVGLDSKKEDSKKSEQKYPAEKKQLFDDVKE